MSGFKRGECTCTDAPKHHKRSGRCRRGCDCKAAQKKAKRKERR